MVRFRQIKNHRTEELSEWKYGIIAKERYSHQNFVSILCENGIIKLPANWVQLCQRKSGDL